MTYPPAYHITWGTYGVRLPGSARPHVTKAQNAYNTPLPERNPSLEALARSRMTQAPIRLTVDHRKCVRDAIHDLAARYGWTIHALAPQSDHVHVVVTAQRVGQDLRYALKAVATKQLNKQFVSQKWWAMGGSCKYLYDPSYFAAAVAYVKRQCEI